MIKEKNVKRLLESIEPGSFAEYKRLTEETQRCSLQEYLKKKQIDDFLTMAFTWRCSPQGHVFWENIDEQIQKYKDKAWFLYRRPRTELPESEYKQTVCFRKSNGRTCIAYLMHDDAIRVHAGCFVGTLKEFEHAATRKYGNDDNENYQPQITSLRKRWPNAKTK